MSHSPITFVLLVSVAAPLLAEDAKLQPARKQAVNIRAQGRVVVRDEVDPQDPRERLLLLTPRGPVIVEATITVESQPFRMKREQLLAEILKSADKDGDGKATWLEAISNPGFVLRRLGYPLGTDQQRDQAIKAWDLDEDGLLSMPELRRLMATYLGGDTFAIASNLAYGMPATPDLKDLLDTDQDGGLSEAELAAATQRMISRDANEDEWLDAADMPSRTPLLNSRNVNPTGPVFLLGPTVDLVAVYNLMRDAYANAEGRITAARLDLVPELFSRLDLDKNGVLQSGEVIGLHIAPPQIELSIRFESMSEPAKLSVERLSAELGEVEKVVAATKDGLTVAVPGMSLVFASAGSPFQGGDYAESAKAMVARFDKDKNGYISKEEIIQDALHFGRWDADADGKVFPEEIAADYEAQQAPIRTQVRGQIAIQSPSFFASIDADNNARLSLREMRNARTRLLTLDADNDNRVALSETPASISLTFSRGVLGAQSSPSVTRYFGQQGVTARRKQSQSPTWFHRMDRNGDGDISPREFLGTKPQFEQFDADKDGLIDQRETGSVKP